MASSVFYGSIRDLMAFVIQPADFDMETNTNKSE
jgi:hypothetical protein